MILDCPICFGKVQIVLVGAILFWSGSNQTFLNYFFEFGPVYNGLDLTKTNWTRPKQLELDQNDLDNPKSFWKHRRTRH